jgi:purine-cytosine permease-like protein
MRYLAWSLLGLLVVLHQDYWQWNDSSLVFNVLPVGLAWHAGISVMAAVVWFMLVTFCWPTAAEVDDEADAIAGAETESCA